MHAFVTTRLDYLNSLLYGMPDYIIKRIQILFDVGFIYFLDEQMYEFSKWLNSWYFPYGALLSRLLEISAIKISYYYYSFNQLSGSCAIVTTAHT